jgi:DNA-binding NtrC family response regulator
MVEDSDKGERTMATSILFVDDDLAMRELVGDAMVRRGFEIVCQPDMETALAAMANKSFDAVITDVKLGVQSGIALCRTIADKEPDLPVIVITAFGSMEVAVAALRAGAYDFITKPVDMPLLALTVERACRHKALNDEVRRLRAAVGIRETVHDLIGASPAMRPVYELISQLSQSDVPVLITGESGTGKELVARALHSVSNHNEGPFVAVNCAAVPDNLLESELFGHVRGAFTDAKQAHPGLFVQANRGTIFLDEVGEMPQEMQVKLLRVLQERVVRPLGSTHETPFDARLISATNRDIEAEIESGSLREDFYYRINVVNIHLPPLRSRGSDILLLAQHFIDTIRERTGKPVTGITSETAQVLLDYDWPGNVRELENCIERAVALTRFQEIVIGDLPDKIRDYESTTLLIGGDNPDEFVTLAEMEKRYVRKVLQATGGNKTHAARILGVGRRTLYRWLERLE